MARRLLVNKEQQQIWRCKSAWARLVSNNIGCRRFEVQAKPAAGVTVYKGVSGVRIDDLMMLQGRICRTVLL